jgi:glycosyltransferase involved in cell wall biosynthesis
MPAGLLVVNTSESWGGNEHWAVRVARGMADRGLRVRFAWSSDVVGQRVAAAGLDGVRIRLRGDGDLRGLLRLREEMVRIRARSVLLTRWREYLLGGLASRVAGRPRVVMGLGLKIVPRADLKRRLVFALADRVLVNAPEIRDALCTRPWIQPDRIDVVINGVDLDRWRPRWHAGQDELGARFRTEHGLAAAAPLLVTVGNLTAQKDHANLVAACAELHSRLPGLQAVILGEGMLRSQLEHDIRTRGLQDVIRLPGFAADVRPALAAADLFVLPSNNEGMAWVLMEAAASGLPIVTTDVSGARTCVADGATGLVVPVQDPEALARALARILADPEAARRMGREGRRLAERRFDARRMLDQTAAVLLAAEQPAAGPVIA